MAEFCLDCMNALDGTRYTERDVILSRWLELCEGCGEMRRVVIDYRRNKWFYDLTRMFRRK